MYLCGPGKHNCQPFCGPEGRFYCSDSVCSLWPAPFSYLCVSVRILCVCWKLSAAEQVKTDCWHTPAVVSTLLTPLPVSCPLTTPLHYRNVLRFDRIRNVFRFHRNVLRFDRNVQNSSETKALVCETSHSLRSSHSMYNFGIPWWLLVQIFFFFFF